MKQVAVLSFWHVHAKDYAAEAIAHPETELIAIWDENGDRGRTEAAKRDVAFAPRLDELLSRPDLDGVIVTTATTAHRQVMLAAASAGKHIFTEKVIAPTLYETEEIVAAAELAGIAYVVSLPRLAAGYTSAIKQAMARGDLGEVTALRIRLGHAGAIRTARDPDGWLPAHFFDPAQAGGGALIDLGCHPLYLARHFIGMPESVSASYGFVTGRAVEDNATVILRYPSGALATIEVAIVAGVSPFSIEAHGTDGSLLFGTPRPTIWRRRVGGEWNTLDELPANGPSPFAQWVKHMHDGTRAPENVAIATDLSELVEAANQSAGMGRPVAIAGKGATAPS